MESQTIAIIRPSAPLLGCESDRKRQVRQSFFFERELLCRESQHASEDTQIFYRTADAQLDNALVLELAEGKPGLQHCHGKSSPGSIVGSER